MTFEFGYFNLRLLYNPCCAFVGYLLASLELIAEEIEDLFGDHPNDPPTENWPITFSGMCGYHLIKKNNRGNLSLLLFVYDLANLLFSKPRL